MSELINYIEKKYPKSVLARYKKDIIILLKSNTKKTKIVKAINELNPDTKITRGQLDYFIKTKIDPKEIESGKIELKSKLKKDTLNEVINHNEEYLDSNYKKRRDEELKSLNLE